MSQFLKIGITLPNFIPNEANIIMELLANNMVDIIHIRKPDWDLQTTIDFINQIPEEVHNRLKIHDHFQLMDKFGLHGVHLNGRNPDSLGYDKNVSKSCHSIQELCNIENLEYVTLSPIYNSISKAGYKKAFDLKSLKTFIKGKNVIALGGVTPDKFKELQQAGFVGAALSGYLFSDHVSLNHIT